MQSHFSAKNIRMLYIESAKTVNEMTLNELVKLTALWTTGPRTYKLHYSEVRGGILLLPRSTNASCSQDWLSDHKRPESITKVKYEEAFYIYHTALMQAIMNIGSVITKKQYKLQYSGKSNINYSTVKYGKAFYSCHTALMLAVVKIGLVITKDQTI